MAKFCGSCGKPLREGASFCPSCGARIRNQAQQIPRIPPQPQYPVYPQQYRQPAPPQKPKGSAARTVISILLVISLLAQIAVAGFWYPGFFRTGEAEPYPGSAAVSGTVPGPEDGVFSYTDEEIAAAPAVSMQVSLESTRATADGFTVDFGPFNLDSADTFTVRTLPVKEGETGGYRYQGYDLSLGSGMSRFPTEVKVMIPRDADDSDLVYFVTADPETGRNTPEYFEISEDGKYYILYTTHFSEHDKMVVSDFSKILSEAIRAGDVSNQMTRDALSAFFYTAVHSPDQVMTGTVWYNPQDLWAKMMGRYTYLPAAQNLLEAMAHQMQAGGLQSVDFSSALFNGVSKLYEAVDVGNNAKGAADGAAEFALRQMSLEGISPGVKSSLQNYSGWNTAHGAALARFSAIFTAIGVLFLNHKISAEAAEGKYATGEQVLKEHWTDYLSVILSTIATGAAYVGTAAAAGTAAAIAAPYVAAGCAIGGLALYFYGRSQKTPYDSLTIAERNYRDFYALTQSSKLYRVFYYDYIDKSDPQFEGDPTIEPGSIAFIERLETLTEAQNEKFKQAVNVDMRELNQSGGFTGSEPRMGLTLDFRVALHLLYQILQDTPDKIEPAFKEFFRHYAEACFYNLTDAEYLTYCRAAMAARGEDANAASLPWKTDAERETVVKDYTGRFAHEMYAACSDLFLYFSIQAQHEAQMKVDEDIRREILPLLNTGVELTVEDKSLENPKDFSRSIYCAEPRRTDIDTAYTAPDGSVYEDNFKYQYEYPLSFWTNDGGVKSRVDAPVFLPSELIGGTPDAATGKYKTVVLRTCGYDKFYPAQDNFVPALVDGTSNVIFRCSYFNYLMMGAPTVLGYKDISQKNSEIKYADFKVDITKAVREGEISVVRVNIELNGKKQETLNSAMYVQQDGSMFFERGANTGGDMPPDCKLTLEPDGTFTLEISAAACDQYSKPCTREAFTVTGRIIAENESSETCLHRKGYIHTVSSSTIRSTAEGREFAFDSFSAYLSNDLDGKNGFDKNCSFVDIMVNPKTGELRDVELTLYANRTSAYPDGTPEFVEKSGIFIWLVPFALSDQPSG